MNGVADADPESSVPSLEQILDSGAHDLRNITSNMVMGARILTSEISDDQLASDVMAQAMHVRLVVDALVCAGRARLGRVPAPGRVDVGDLVADAARRYGIQIELEAGTAAMHVQTDSLWAGVAIAALAWRDDAMPAEVSVAGVADGVTLSLADGAGQARPRDTSQHELARQIVDALGGRVESLSGGRSITLPAA